MSTPDVGGYAFPVPITFRPSDGAPMTAGDLFEGNGMTLRDYLAASATQPDIDHHSTTYSPDKGVTYLSREQAKYAYADAMIEARSNPLP